ncbi:hypothetical protein GCM10011316_22890 [Roseibium aquae]|uniref:Excisionase family DNA binding protein n=1 Tax=Roseibium aquae TaxID=1323746 RepID=A0A916TMS8_9HYPH|nr:hypothetical protein [Roseibium aquae]GGB50210.1 hypothetical protein GCM10011316_22890 [Roseibium aquae]
MTVRKDLRTMLELSRPEAAALLYVPLGHLDAFLAKEKIEYVYHGAEPRVRLHDVMAYKRKRETVRARALNEIAKLNAAMSPPTVLTAPLPLAAAAEDEAAGSDPAAPSPAFV